MSNNQSQSSAPSLLDPEALAFQALLSAICTNCLTQGTTSRDDISKIVVHYKPRYPQLTAELIENGIVTASIPKPKQPVVEKPPEAKQRKPKKKKEVERGRRVGRPSKRHKSQCGAKDNDGNADHLAIEDDDLKMYHGEKGELRLMGDLLSVMPSKKSNLARYTALENHVNNYGVGNLDGLGYSTFNGWVRGQRKANGLDLEHKRAMLSFIRRGDEDESDEDSDEDDESQEATDNSQLNNTSSPKRHRKYICTVEGCTTLVKANGLCYKHGGRSKTKQLRKRCSVNRCTNQAVKGGVCHRHGAPKVKKPCSEEGCKNIAVAGNTVCIRHGAITTKTKICSVEACENKVVKAGVCRKHAEPCSYEGCTNNVVVRGLCKRHGALGPQRKICSVHDCTNYVYNRGVCQRHGHVPPPICRYKERDGKGCRNKAKRRGLCMRHSREVLEEMARQQKEQNEREMLHQGEGKYDDEGQEQQQQQMYENHHQHDVGWEEEEYAHIVGGPAAVGHAHYSTGEAAPYLCRQIDNNNMRR